MTDGSDSGTAGTGPGAPDTDIAGTADTMRGRAGESQLKLWLLMGADRRLVAGVLTGGTFVAFVVAVAVLEPPFARQIRSGDAIETLFSTMITVIVTGTTLVVTIGQLVLTQENGPLGDQRDRMANSMDVREYAEEVIGSPSPADPSAFLGELVDAAADRARALRASVDDIEGDARRDASDTDDAFRADLDAFTDSLIGNADAVRDQLDGARFGTFDVLFAALNFNYSWKVFEVERLADEYDGRLTEHQHDLLDQLKTALSLFGVAREHVKTLYFQWALIDLSRGILYVAVPALAVAGVMVAVVDAGTFPGSTLGVAHVTLVVGAAFAVTLTPFMLFVSYVFRVLTVAKRTLAIEPLILRDTER